MNGKAIVSTVGMVSVDVGTIFRNETKAECVMIYLEQNDSSLGPSKERKNYFILTKFHL